MAFWRKGNGPKRRGRKQGSGEWLAGVEGAGENLAVYGFCMEPRGGGEGEGGPQGKPAAQGAGRLWAAKGRHGGGTPPALRAARLRHRVAQLQKVWPPGVPLMQKSAEIRGKMQTKA